MSEAGHRYTFGAPSKGWPTFGPDGKIVTAANRGETAASAETDIESIVREELEQALDALDLDDSQLLDALLHWLGIDIIEARHVITCDWCEPHDEGGPYRCPTNPVERQVQLERDGRRIAVALGRAFGSIPGPSPIEVAIFKTEKTLTECYRDQLAHALAYEPLFLRLGRKDAA